MPRLRRPGSVPENACTPASTNNGLALSTTMRCDPAGPARSAASLDSNDSVSRANAANLAYRSRTPTAHDGEWRANSRRGAGCPPADPSRAATTARGTSPSRSYRIMPPLNAKCGAVMGRHQQSRARTATTARASGSTRPRQAPATWQTDPGHQRAGCRCESASRPAGCVSSIDGPLRAAVRTLRLVASRATCRFG